MRVVVTGATGFVGTGVVNELLKQNTDVTVIVRNVTQLPCYWNGKVTVIEADLSSIHLLERADFGKEKIDVFFHFAWSGTAGNERADVDLQLNNVRYVCDAIALAKKLGCSRFINSGSIMEYEAYQYLKEDKAAPGMGYIYSTAKLTGDFFARICAKQADIEYINLIISNIYGVGEFSQRFLNSTLRKMMKNEPIDMTAGLQLYDFIYITDAAEAICMVAKCGEANSSYYIGNTCQRELRKFVLIMKEVVKSTSEIRFGAVPFTGAQLTYEEFDTAKIEQLGFTPKVSFEEGIRRTKEWIAERENND